MIAKEVGIQLSGRVFMCKALGSIPGMGWWWVDIAKEI